MKKCVFRYAATWLHEGSRALCIGKRCVFIWQPMHHSLIPSFPGAVHQRQVVSKQTFSLLPYRWHQSVLGDLIQRSQNAELSHSSHHPMFFTRFLNIRIQMNPASKIHMKNPLKTCLQSSSQDIHTQITSIFSHFTSRLARCVYQLPQRGDLDFLYSCFKY